MNYLHTKYFFKKNLPKLDNTCINLKRFRRHFVPYNFYAVLKNLNL